MAWRRVAVSLAAEQAEPFADALLEAGALSASIEQDRSGGQAEHALFGEPDTPEPGLWPDCMVDALLPLEASAAEVHVQVLQDEETLVILVRDTGTGFSPAILAEIGTPYHSTKGQPGRGLGLFLVFNVVRKLGGTVSADNRPQGGAVVTLNLPLAALAIGAPSHVG